jgi:sugar (pentulose or hexulose) kinase
LQVLADVFGLPVYTLRQANSAGLGAAYIAYWKGEGRYDASARMAHFSLIALLLTRAIAYIRSFTAKMENVTTPVLAVEPRAEAHKAYTGMLPVYEELENIVRATVPAKG